MSSLIVKMLIAAGATTLVGCGKKTASSESPTTSPASTTPTGLKATQLVGTWLSACEKDKSGEGATTTIMTFAEKSAVITTNIYTDGECKNIENAFVLNATFTLGGEVNGVSGAKKIDYPVTKAQITPLTGAIASAYNTNRLCGITDWTVNVARDAAGDCELKAGVTHYDIVKLDGT